MTGGASDQVLGGGKEWVSLMGDRPMPQSSGFLFQSFG